jgi:hypothetical protein
VDTVGSLNRASFSLSHEGILMFTGDTDRYRLMWFSRDGKVLGTVSTSDRYAALRVSPDGNDVAVSLVIPSGNRDIRQMELARGLPNRLTKDGGYVPVSQWGRPVPPYTFYIGVRSSTESPARIARSVGAALRRINDDVTLGFEPLARQVDESLAPDRVLAILSGFFGSVALLLAGLGLYGVTTYAVARRRMEIGIRMALGAEQADVVRLVLFRLALAVGVGVLAGAALTVWVSTLVAPLLYGLDPHDPATFLGSAITLTVIGALAGGVPAWRASRIDAALLLREG